MLPKKHRLSGLQIKATKSGQKQSSQLLSIIYSPNVVGHIRAGVIIGKKINPNATVRNHLKRQILNSLKPIISKSSLDIIILPKPAATSATYQNISDQLQKLINDITINN